MRTRILAALAASLSVFHLPATGQQPAHTTFTSFPAERQLSGKPYWKSKDPTIEGLDLYADSLLLMRHKSGHAAHFSLMNIKQAAYVATAVPVGNQYGQSTGFISYGLQRNNLWVYDLIKDKIIIHSLSNTMAGNAPAVREIPIPVFYYSVQLMNDSTLLGSGDYDSPAKLSLINLSTRQSPTPLTPYDPVWPRAKKNAYESFLFLKPTGDKCVLACRYADQVEVIDLTTQESIIVNGPENYQPDVTEMTGNDGKELSARNESTRYAFVRGKTTNRYIYLLYSGNNSESSHLYYGKYVFVYDWQGKPVRKITLSSYAVDFAVTSDDATIYTYHPSSQSIEIASLQP